MIEDNLTCGMPFKMAKNRKDFLEGSDRRDSIQHLGRKASNSKPISITGSQAKLLTKTDTVPKTIGQKIIRKR